jgi:hypothetical protein
MSKKFLSPIKLAQGTTNPATGSAGELFFNTTDVKVYAHNGTTWVPSGGGVTVSATAPSTPIAGDAWYDTVDGTLYVYYNDGDSSQWVEVAANSGISVALEGRVGVVETYVTTLQSEMDAVEVRATSLETRATALELADSTTNRAGLVPIIPSSVTLDSGSGSIDTNGLITISGGATNIGINSCFNSNFKKYEIFYSLDLAADASVAHRLRSGSTNETAAYYDRTMTYVGGNTAGGQTVNAQDSWNIGVTGDRLQWGTIVLDGPFLATKTVGFSSMGQGNSSRIYSVSTGSLKHRLSNSYDGFNILSTTTLTGTIQIYGLR